MDSMYVKTVEFHNTGMVLFDPKPYKFLVKIDSEMIKGPFFEIPLDIVAHYEYIQDMDALLVSLKEDMH
jgi:hypothetical protein